MTAGTAGADDDPGPGPGSVRTSEPRPPSGERAWLLTLLPAFPLLLLVLRVWYLARQDLQTMLLVLQSANPLGLIASLLISLLWALPTIVLLLRALFLLLLVSETPSRSWLARVGLRMPNWVSVPAALLAALAWQLRFLPTLLALVLVIGGLEVRQRLGPRRFATSVAGLGIPVAVGLVTLIWLAPAIVDAFRVDEPVIAVLLLLPPIAAPLLCGPIPAGVARWLLPGTASVLALSIPILLGTSYLHTPVLPRVAVESTVEATDSSDVAPEDADTAQENTDPAPENTNAAPKNTAPENTDPATKPAAAPTVTVQRGSLVAVDDRFTTLLDSAGQVHFLPGGQITAQVLCFTGPEPPGSSVSIHGWQVEQSILSWAAPRPREASADPRCRGD